jgi:hypothetical protein
MAARKALIVVTARNDDSKLSVLEAEPPAYVLARLLDDPAIGGFSVERLLDVSASRAASAVHDLLADAAPDDLAAFRDAMPTTGLGLDLDDMYSPDEPVTVRITPERPVSPPLVIEVENLETNTVVHRTLRLHDDGSHQLELNPLPWATYRLKAFGAGSVEPVTDLFVVLSDDSG